MAAHRVRAKARPDDRLKRNPPHPLIDVLSMAGYPFP
jgi:hypothetical protein